MASVTLVSLTFEKVWDSPDRPFKEVIPVSVSVSFEQETLPEASVVSFPPFEKLVQFRVLIASPPLVS